MTVTCCLFCNERYQRHFFAETSTSTSGCDKSNAFRSGGLPLTQKCTVLKFCDLLDTIQLFLSGLNDCWLRGLSCAFGQLIKCEYTAHIKLQINRQLNWDKTSCCSIGDSIVFSTEMNFYFQSVRRCKMASIDRHQYSEDIRKGAAKFIDNLNLGTSS